MSSWKLPSVLTHMAWTDWLGQNSICRPRYHEMKGISAAQSQSVFHEWNQLIELDCCTARLLCRAHWMPPRSLGLVRVGWTVPLLLINMHIMLLLCGFLQGFCTHFHWQKQWKVIQLKRQVIYQQLNSLLIRPQRSRKRIKFLQQPDWLLAWSPCYLYGPSLCLMSGWYKNTLFLYLWKYRQELRLFIWYLCGGGGRWREVEGDHQSDASRQDIPGGGGFTDCFLPAATLIIYSHCLCSLQSFIQVSNSDSLPGLRSVVWSLR